jgi:hypothetical protein
VRRCGCVCWALRRPAQKTRKAPTKSFTTRWVVWRKSVVSIRLYPLFVWSDRSYWARGAQLDVPGSRSEARNQESIAMAAGVANTWSEGFYLRSRANTEITATGIKPRGGLAVGWRKWRCSKHLYLNGCFVVVGFYLIWRTFGAVDGRWSGVV